MFCQHVVPLIQHTHNPLVFHPSVFMSRDRIHTIYTYTLPSEVVKAGLEAPEFWVSCTVYMYAGSEAGFFVDNLSPLCVFARFRTFC